MWGLIVVRHTMTSLSRFQCVGKWMQGGLLFLACLASTRCTRSPDAVRSPSPPVTLAVSTVSAVGSVVLVVGIPLRESDRRLQARIEIRTGLPVAVIADSGATIAAVSGAKAIVVSESADSAAIGGRLRDVAVPQLISEPSLFDDMGFTGPKWSDDYGDSTNDSELFILLPNSELAAMLPSPSAVFNNANKAVWGKPQGAVQRVAAIGSATDSRTAIFAYEKAAGIIGGSAAERRVGWFAGRDAPLSFTSQAWQLFDSSLFWLLRMDPNNRPEPPERKALLVVGPGELSTSDQALRQRLESSFGLLTLVSSDDKFSVDMARHAEFVLFSETVRSEQIGGAIQNLTVPVFAMEPALFPRLRFTGTGWQSDFGDSEGQSHIRISKDTPLTGGRSGQVAVTTVGRKFVWARPKGDAVVTASLSNDASKAAIFSYESDSKLADGSLTPARRIGWFGGRFVPETLTPEGWVLFDSAIAWISRARALLTVGPSSLSNGDKRIRDRLGELGFVVRVRSDSSTKPADFEEQHLVVVSQSVRSNELKSVLTAQATAVPMLVMEPALFDDLGLTGDEQSGGFGIETGQTALAITAPQHPLAAMLSGTQSVASAPAAFAWGKPASSSIVVARSLNQTDHAFVFAYDEGATLLSGEKNAFRKVGWFASDSGFESLNAKGQQMFDSAVGWTSGRSRVRPRVQHAPGARAKEFLSTIADPEERGRTAFVVLSTMAAIRRVSEGRTTSALEGKLVNFWNNADFFTRKQLVNVGNALDGFTQAERANLLGPFANLDPGDGRSITPPAVLAAQVAQVPRIRTNACAGNTGYEGGLDPTLAQRSVTTGGEIIAKLAIVDPDGGVIASANLSAPSARPRLSGIQKTEDVRGYDAAIGRPSLEDDRLRNRDCGVRGDGISPYGVFTDIACSASAPCDQETGLICGSVLRGLFPRSDFRSTRCYAFPVLSPKGSVIMRGHNFWDTSDAQLEYRPLSDPSAQPTLVGLSESGVVGNEGIDQLTNCALPVGRGSPGSRECKATEDTANRNHNSASFPVPAGLAGGFF